MNNSFLIKILLGFIILFSHSAFSYEQNKVYKLTVLHTNDHHGAFWKSKDGEYGMSARATLIKEIRAEAKKKGSHVLLLSGGDINTGTPASEFSDAKPDFLGMSYMGYNAMAVGNHEFDKPFDILMKQKNDWANFPFLSANIYNKKSNKRTFKPFVTVEFGKLKVALLGLTTDQTAQQSIRFPKDKLMLKSPISEAKKILPELKKKHDVVIALTHMGHYPDGDHGSRSAGDVSLARETNGIDLIVGGHSQKALEQIDLQNGTSIVQAGEMGKYLGRIDMEFLNGKSRVVNYELIPINLKDKNGYLIGKKIKEDKKLKKLLSPYKKQSDKKTSEVVGCVVGQFEGHRSVIRKRETNLGNFVTFLMATNTDADLAVTDSGVIRTSLPKGDVTYGDILSVHPFAFSLNYAYVELTGKELHHYLSEVAIKTSGAYPQFYGVKITLKDSDIIKILIKNKSTSKFELINKNKTYRLALTDFIARGGDGYPIVNRHPTYKVTDIVDAEAMRNFFIFNKLVDVKQFEPINNLTILQ